MNKLNTKNRFNIIKYITIGSCLLSSNYLLGSMGGRSSAEMQKLFPLCGGQPGGETAIYTEAEMEEIGRQLLLDRELLDSAETGTKSNVQALLEQGANPNVRDPSGNTPLGFAIRRDDPEMLRMLIAQGALPVVFDDLPLLCDVSLLRYGIPLLHYAARHGSWRVTAMLLKQGDDVHFLDVNGRTALDQVRKVLGRTEVKLGAKVTEIAGLPPTSCRSKSRQNYTFKCGQVKALRRKMDNYQKVEKLLIAHEAKTTAELTAERMDEE